MNNKISVFFWKKEKGCFPYLSTVQKSYLLGFWPERAGLPVHTCRVSSLSWTGEAVWISLKVKNCLYNLAFSYVTGLLHVCIQYQRKRDLEPTVCFPEKLLLYRYTYSSVWEAQVLSERNLACSPFILVRRDELDRVQPNSQSPNCLWGCK